MTPTLSGGRRRALFLDIDGTYAHHGVVPPEHEEAVRSARAAGHLVFLCTGRPLSLLTPRIVAAGFDGYVAGAGMYASVGDTVLVNDTFPADLAARALEALDAHGALYLLEAAEATYARPATIDAMTHRSPAGGMSTGRRDILAALTPAEDLAGLAFGKVASFHAGTPLAQIAHEVGPELTVLPSSIPELGPGAGEMFLAGMHKALGIAAVVEHLGLDREDVIGFGDGLNDVEMLEYAGVGVAIEGARPSVLAAADRVARGPQHAGLAEAFSDLGLLE